MATGPEQRLSPDDRANLVAYIDGELTDAESRAMATKLTQSATARREVDSLKRTWELLDHLPRPAATPHFTERTQTAILGLDARGEAFRQGAGAWLSLAGRAGILALSAAVLAGGGFALTRWAWPDPHARLLRDLSLAEHLKEYQDVGSFDFLDELARSSEFGPAAGEVSP